MLLFVHKCVDYFCDKVQIVPSLFFKSYCKTQDDLSETFSMLSQNVLKTAPSVTAEMV